MGCTVCAATACRDASGSSGSVVASRAMSSDARLDDAARLAHEHDAATLAAALVARLRLDGRTEHAHAVFAMLSGEAVGILNPNPPDPH